MCFIISWHIRGGGERGSLPARLGDAAALRFWGLVVELLSFSERSLEIDRVVDFVIIYFDIQQRADDLLLLPAQHAAHFAVRKRRTALACK